MWLRIKESAQPRDYSFPPFQTMDPSYPIYKDGLCQSAGAKVLDRGREVKMGASLVGAGFGWVATV